MDNTRFHVITGASGGGKSTLVAALKDLGYSTVPEAALAIMREQLECNGKILPSVDRTAFMEAVLARSIRDYETAQSLNGPVFFDRGIPEWVRYLGASAEPSAVAATSLRYASTIFVAEPWPDIYVCDHYRQHGFERAARSYETTISAYIGAGYKTCVLPKASVQERVEFIRAKLETIAQQGAPADVKTASQFRRG
ncbi:AAA family ATPase [Halothiobacillus neapolitanus]|uniref:AAA family ATPase n=1 Tax=Halothiobacillus neapolitanus TaxID=927 RepID=UPI000198052B|nr:AAA family ATPase [Halothiobacillus neapolitanus]TDN57342.1 putative ATPase [Halothiobacillus neapolitanus]